MKKIFLVCLSLLLLNVLQAQDSTIIEQYRAKALRYNHDLKAALKSINISIELEKSARADMKPKVNGAIDFQYTGNPMQINFPPIEVTGGHNRYGASLSVLQPIYTGGVIAEAIRMAQIKQSYAVNEMDFIKSSICFQTDIQYWNTVARRELVDVTATYRDAVAALVKVIKERVEVGLTDPTDLLMAEVKLNEADYQLMQMENNFRIGVMALNSIIGVTLSDSTYIEASLPIVTARDYVSLSSVGERPELSMMKDRVLMEKSNLRLVDSKYKPQILVGANGDYSSPSYNFAPDMNPNFALYAKLSVPIFEWGKRRSEKRSSGYRIAIANDNLNRVKDAVTLEVESCRVDVQQATQRVIFTENSLGKAKENEDKMTERYHQGKVSITEVIDAQLYYQASLINFVQSKLEAQSQLSKLKNVLNIK